MPLALGSLDDDLGTKMGEDAIVAVMRDVCAGLAYIHDKGILHRDLKPQNVLRTQYGAWAIADLGLARAVAETSIRLTSTADAMGTAFYTAPEQWLDAKHVAETADVYSAGKIAQAMLVAGTPAGDNVPTGKLAPVIRRAISHSPQHRHQTAAQPLTAIETAVAAVTPGGRWETSAEKAARLRQRLAVLPDVETVREIIRWADQAEPGELSDFAQAFSAMPVQAVQAWWQQGPDSFTHAFQVFATGLEGGFVFGMCDPLADFARIVLTVTRDQVILREAIRGLALLGYNHNKWHVRDVAVEILQGISDDTDAVQRTRGSSDGGPTRHRMDSRERGHRHLPPNSARRDKPDLTLPGQRSGPPNAWQFRLRLCARFHQADESAPCAGGEPQSAACAVLSVPDQHALVAVAANLDALAAIGAAVAGRAPRGLG